MNTNKARLGEARFGEARFGESLRIIWAIAAKDIVDAIKNKATLSTMFSVLFLMVFYRVLPSWESGDILPRVAVYDAGNTRLVAEMEESSHFDLFETSSQQEMEEYLGHKDMVVLGLVMPAGLDQAMESAERVELEGYSVHWASDSAAAEVQQFFESQLTELAGNPVRINIAGNTVYTQRDSHGVAFLASASLIIVIMLIGFSIAPNLMIEEKQTKTIDVLLVSPASISQVVIGKALTGLFYCLTAAGVALAFYTSLVTHWWLAILAVVCGSLFAVTLGLLLGSLLKVKQQLTLWTWVLFIPIVIPTFLSIMEDLFPVGFIRAIGWMPTVALAKVFRLSFSGSAPLAQFGPELALVLGYAVLVLAVVALVVRRSDR